MTARIILRGPAQKARAMQLLDELVCDPKRPMEFILQPFEEDRTLAQNKLYRACVGEAAREIGYSNEELHNVLLAQYFGAKTITLGKTSIVVPIRRTTVDEEGNRKPLTKKAMSVYYEWAMAFLATEFGVTV